MYVLIQTNDGKCLRRDANGQVLTFATQAEADAFIEARNLNGWQSGKPTNWHWASPRWRAALKRARRAKLSVPSQGE